MSIFLSSSPVLSLVQISLLNYVFLASWAFALPYSQYRPLASSVCTVWTCVIIVCKMLYQLKTIDPDPYNCTLVNIFCGIFCMLSNFFLFFFTVCNSFKFIPTFMTSLHISLHVVPVLLLASCFLFLCTARYLHRSSKGGGDGVSAVHEKGRSRKLGGPGEESRPAGLPQGKE